MCNTARKNPSSTAAILMRGLQAPCPGDPAVLGLLDR